MLITRQGGRVGCALAAAYCQRRVHRKAFSQIVKETELEDLVAGQVSPRKYAGHQRVLLRTRGFTR